MTVLAVAAHSTAARTGTATVAGRIVTISQGAPCAFDVSPMTVPASSLGGPVLLTITLSSGDATCRWTAQSNAGFITVNCGIVSITIAANTGAARTGTVTVGGQDVTVSQVGSLTSSSAIAVLSYQSAPGDFIDQGVSDTLRRDGTQFKVTVNTSRSQLLSFSTPPPAQHGH